jgi:CheY-like chemotaxis protein
VVDDNVDAAVSLAALLAVLGHDVSVAYEGLQALETLCHWHAEFVVLDVRMPHMDGLSLARHIRAMNPQGQPHIIALTACGSPSDRMATEEAGIDVHLVKPAEIEVLCAVLTAEPRS